MTEEEIKIAAESITMLFVKERFDLPISRETNKELLDVRKAIDLAEYYAKVYKIVRSTLEKQE